MNGLGTELSIQLFRPATWVTQSARSWPAADYPGVRPTGSWLMDRDGTVRGLDPAGSGWRDRGTGEDVDISDRDLVLAYGSNPDPRKLLGRQEFFGGDSVIVLRAVVFGWAAAWCDARRHFDKSVVATLVDAPGRVEVHPVLALTHHQLTAMDAWEGHPRFYRRRAHVGEVLLESGEWARDVQVYLGTPERRPVLMVDGRQVFCAEVPYREAHSLVDR